MRLKKYIKEQTLGTNQYPNLFAIPEAVKRLNKILELMDEYKDGIPNPKMKDVKHNLNNIMDYMWEGMTAGGPTDFWRWAYDKDLLVHYPHQLKGRIKKVEKMPQSDFRDKWLARAKEMNDLFLKFKAIPVVKKVAKKKDSAEERYVKKLASSEAIKLVNDALTEMVDKISKDYIDSRVKELTVLWKKFLEADPVTQRKMRMSRGSGLGHLTNPGTTEKDIIKMAEWEAKGLRDGFLFKNVDKLANILEKKGQIKNKPKMLSYRKGSFYGTMKFEFDDGSSFYVTNKVVWKMNRYGTQFYQYPTTFHEVKLPDGSKMPRPSEKRMIEVFANAI